MKRPVKYADVKAAIAELRGKVPGVSLDELTQDVHAVMASAHGAEAVGALELYLVKARGHWTLEACIADAQRYRARGEWAKANCPAYDAARTNGWLEECCAHMEARRRPNGWWTLARCMEDAKRFKSRVEWQERSGAAFFQARKEGWLEQCTVHMKLLKQPKGHWTRARCREIAKRYSSRTEWSLGHPASYSAAHRNGWADACTAHMKLLVVPGGLWSFEDCLEAARRFSTRGAWKKGDASTYNAACRRGWLDECCAHMTKVLNSSPRGYWTLNRCKAAAAGHGSRFPWRRANRAAYDAALRNGWLDLIFPPTAKGKKR